MVLNGKIEGKKLKERRRNLSENRELLFSPSVKFSYPDSGVFSLREFEYRLVF